MSIRLVFLFLLVPASASIAQRIDTLKGVMRSFYFPTQDLILRTYSDGISVSSPDNPAKEKRQVISSWTMDEAFSYFHLDKNDILLIHQINGSIFRVGKDSLEVLEKFDHSKMFIESNVFEYKSEFYWLGGYGLWSARERLLKINSDRRWEPILLKRVKLGEETPLTPPGVFANNTLINNDRLFVFNGRTVKTTDPMEVPRLKDVWIFDFQEKNWERAGQINDEIFTDFPQNRIAIEVENRFIMLNNQRAIIELFPNENKVVLYRHTLNSSDVLRSDLSRHPAFYRNGRIYFYRSLIPSYIVPIEDQIFELTSVPIKNFLGEKIDEGVFYIEEGWVVRNSTLLLISIIIAGCVGILFFYRRPRAKLEITKTGIRYKGKNYEVAEMNLKVLKRLYDSDGPVSSQEILEIVQNPNLQYSHNNRVKNDVIRQLNIQLQSILNTSKDLITMTASETDKRYKGYQLMRGRF